MRPQPGDGDVIDIREEQGGGRNQGADLDSSCPPVHDVVARQVGCGRLHQPFIGGFEAGLKTPSLLDSLVTEAGLKTRLY